jgi:hypothetical protein
VSKAGRFATITVLRQCHTSRLFQSARYWRSGGPFDRPSVVDNNAMAVQRRDTAYRYRVSILIQQSGMYQRRLHLHGSARVTIPPMSVRPLASAPVRWRGQLVPIRPPYVVAGAHTVPGSSPLLGSVRAYRGLPHAGSCSTPVLACGPHSTAPRAALSLGYFGTLRKSSCTAVAESTLLGKIVHHAARLVLRCALCWVLSKSH